MGAGVPPPLIMAAAVPLYGAIPFLLDQAGGDGFSLGAVGVWFAAFAVLLAGFVAVAGEKPGSVRHGRRGLLSVSRRSVSVFGWTLRAVPLRYVAASMVCVFQWPLFSLAAQRIDISVATVVYEFHPLLFAAMVAGPWFAARSRRLDVRDAAAGPQPAQGRWAETLAMLLLGGIGVALTTLSDQGQIPEWGSRLATGFGLAIAAALLAAASSVVSTLTGIQAGTAGRPVGDVSRMTAAAAVKHRTAASTANVAVSYGTIGVVLLAAAAVASQPITLRHATLGLALGFVHGVGTLFFLAANQKAVGQSDLLIAATNGVFYCVPVAALTLLSVTGSIDLARPEMLLVGASGVVAVNMVMHLNPEGAGGRTANGGYGYRAIVVALWLSGTVVMFREDWMPDTWVQSSVVEYWGMVGVCATVFVLIMSFRQNRLDARRLQMDEMMLRLHARADDLAQTGVLSDGRAVSMTLRELDTRSQSAAISDSYRRARELLEPQLSEARRDDRRGADALRCLLADIDVFTNLRRQGRSFAEMAVMSLFAGLTVMLALFVRPEGTTVPFAGFVNDVVTMVLAAAFAFLVSDLTDKRREADAALIEVDSAETSTRNVGDADGTTGTSDFVGGRLAIGDEPDPTADRWMSGLLGGALVAMFTAVLYAKWLPL